MVKLLLSVSIFRILPHHLFTTKKTTMDDKKNIVREYTNGEITVVWKPGKCTHATNCWHELPEVFNPKMRPWINAEAASSAHIIEQIEKCPSGALSYFYNERRE